MMGLLDRQTAKIHVLEQNVERLWDDMESLQSRIDMLEGVQRNEELKLGPRLIAGKQRCRRCGASFRPGDKCPSCGSAT